MVIPGPEHISLFKVKGRDDHSAYYHYRIDTEVPSGQRDRAIDELLRSEPPSEHVEEHDRGRGPPERDLDIKETRNRGVCTYIFQLDADYGDHQLKFVENKPFIHLPLNADGLEVLESRVLGGGKLASFTYDLWGLYDSSLAHRIRKAAKEHGHAVRPVLNIPFCFNVVDSELMASPWAVPRHSHGKGRDILTHGGVHPAEVSFIGMEL